MAFIFTDGCDSYNGAASSLLKYDTNFGNTSTTLGRFGGGCLTGPSSPFVSWQKVFPLTGTAATTDEFFFGVSMKLIGLPAAQAVLFGFMNESTTLSSGSFTATDSDTHLSLRLSSAGVLQIARGSTLLASGTTVLSASLYYRIEVRIVVANAGIFEVRVNGVAEITFAGDTYDTGEAGLRAVVGYGHLSGSNTLWDDILIWNSASSGSEPTTWIGDIRIETLRPTAPGDVTDSTPSTGAAWAAVDETVANADTDYTQAGTVGNKDLYQMGDLSTTPDSVVAVVLNAQMKTTGTTPRKAKLKVKNSTEANSAAKPVAIGSYSTLQAAFALDPATSAAWTGAGVNAAQIGWEVDT